MNRGHLSGHTDDDRLEGVIQTMELGFRMQTAAPELLDLRGESSATLERYGVGKRFETGRSKASDFGRQCLLARRFAEAGVRFIELDHRDWDQHENHTRDLSANCASIDAPIAALLEDLEHSGLLEDTLVVWGGEFGRPGMLPGQEDNAGSGHKIGPSLFGWLAAESKAVIPTGSPTTPVPRVVERESFIFTTYTRPCFISWDWTMSTWLSCREARVIRLTGAEGGKIVRENIGRGKPTLSGSRVSWESSWSVDSLGRVTSSVFPGGACTGSGLFCALPAGNRPALPFSFIKKI